MTFQVTHLVPFLLANLLLPQLTAASDGARVIAERWHGLRHSPAEPRHRQD
jgi:hypothetical protein